MRSCLLIASMLLLCCVPTARAQGPSLTLVGSVDHLPPITGLRRVTPGVSIQRLQLVPSAPGIGAPYALGASLSASGQLGMLTPGAPVYPLLNSITATGGFIGGYSPTLPGSGILLDLPIPTGVSEGTWLSFQGFTSDPTQPSGLAATGVVQSMVEGTSTMTSLTDPTVGVLGQFAIEMIVVDLERDGINELIIGARGADGSLIPDAGKVYVYEGMSTVPKLILESPSPQTGAEFGVSLSSGDVNGDGHLDLIIGSREASVMGMTGAGAVHVFWGPTFVTATQLVASTPTARAQFGGWVASGDFDADGYDDVAVAAIAHPVAGSGKEGQVSIYFGPNLGVPLEIPNPNPGTAGRFGYRVVVDDFDQDGFDDLACSEVFASLLPGGTDRSGAVHLFPGPFMAQHIYVPNPAPLLTSEGLMGSDMISHDMDQDGYPDLVVGAELDSSPGLLGQGSVMLLRGPYFQVLDYVASPTPLINEGFGSGVGAGDFNGDGIPDLFAGAFYYDSGPIVQAGRAHILLGPDYVQFETFEEPVQGAAFQFGRRVRAGDLNGDGFEEMLIGAPFSSANGVSRAGAMYIVTP